MRLCTTAQRADTTQCTAAASNFAITLLDAAAKSSSEPGVQNVTFTLPAAYVGMLMWPLPLAHAHWYRQLTAPLACLLVGSGRAVVQFQGVLGTNSNW